MKNTKKNSVLTEAIDKRKPLVKEFLNPDQRMNEFLSIRLPSITKCRAYPKLVYLSQDHSIRRYRVNWYRESGQMDKSAYYEILLSGEEMTLRDLSA